MSRDITQRARNRWCLPAAASFTLAIALPAVAALGGDEATVQADQAQIRGSLRIARTARYAVHEIEAPSGTIVKQYVSPAGKVFAVAWQGPRMPDLRQVLGEHFDAYLEAVRNKRARGPVSIRQPGLVVHSSGHMRAFVGKAYLPEMLPQGVAADEIR